MAAVASDSVSIQSTYVYFGTVKFGVLKPTVVNTNHITVNIQDMFNTERFCIQIAFKHICKALICQSVQQKAIAFLVNQFCVNKIRQALKISTVPEATIGNSAPYFDSESARVCQRYILIDITRCSSNEMHILKRVLHLVRESKLLMRAQNDRGPVATTSSNDFFGYMDKSDFEKLMRDIGHCAQQIPGNTPDLTLRLSANNINIRPVNTYSQSSLAHSNNNSRRPLSSVYAQETIRPTNAVNQQRNTAVHQPFTSRAVNLGVQRPVSINIVHVLPSQKASTSLLTSSIVPVTTGRGTVKTQPPMVLQRSVGIGAIRYPLRKSPVLTTKPGLDSSNYHSVCNEASTSRIGLQSQETKIFAQKTTKRIVHVIDDDDDEADSSKPTKEPRLDLLLNYPRDQPNSIPVHYADVEYLRPNEMLNDTIIEFYLKYIHMELVPPERRSSIFIFSPFFYSRLTQMPTNGHSVIRNINSRAKWIAENYKRVRTWTKNVDIFSVDYIIVPIVEDIHWYLAIITFPRYAIMDRRSEKAADVEEKDKLVPKKLRKTRIIILDSLADATDIKRKLTVPVLRDYLVCEYGDKRRTKDQDMKYLSKEQMEKLVPLPVPQQRNYTDCGLFLLKFAEYFLLNPPTFITRNDSFRRWYPTFTIKGMRRTILTKLKSVCDEKAWKDYEEYSRSHDANSQSVETALPHEGVQNRSPSPESHRRSLSTGDNEMRWRRCRRRRSLPSRFLSS